MRRLIAEISASFAIFKRTSCRRNSHYRTYCATSHAIANRHPNADLAVLLQMGEPKLCIAIIDDELALPTCELSITAQEARRLLIWVGKRKLGEQATDEHALQLAVPVAGRDTVLLTHPRQFRQLDHRSGRSAFSLYDRRAS